MNVKGLANVMKNLSPRAHVVYLSSAALLRPNSQGGTDFKFKGLGLGAARSYLATKSHALRMLLSDPTLQGRLTVLYPTLVLGSHHTKWQNAIMRGVLPTVLRAGLLDSSVQFIHARDAAAVACHLVDNPNKGRRYSSGSYNAVRLPSGTRALFDEHDSRWSRRNDPCARHLVLGQVAETSLWTKTLGGLLGGAGGFALGAVGAPVADVAAAGW